MNAKELASMLNGREYLKEITKEECKIAKESGLLVCFGYSDDNLELRGSIYDEISAYNGTRITIDADNKEIFPDVRDEGFCKRCFDRARKIVIVAVWSPAEPDCSWFITSDTSHESFDIMEDGELFCRGAVIDISKP